MGLPKAEIPVIAVVNGWQLIAFVVIGICLLMAHAGEESEEAMTMQLPDFQGGYGTEVEESVGWFNYLPWVLLALAALLVVYAVRRMRKAGKQL